MIPKKYKILAISSGVLGILCILFMGYVFYKLSTENGSQGGSGGGMILVMLVLGLLLGGLLMYLSIGKLKPTPPVVKESSHTVAQSLKKVFKVVSAEGHFSEIYNYEETKKLLNFIPSKKRALVIVEANVLVGYDFEKLKWEMDADTRTVRLIEFPEPEILSTETEYKYYNIEEQLFNLFSREDLSNIQKNSKAQVIEAAKASHLPQAAKEQMQMLLTELLSSKNFTLENANLITQKADGLSLPNRSLNLTNKS